MDSSHCKKEISTDQANFENSSEAPTPSPKIIWISGTKNEPKKKPYTCLSWSWQSFPFLFCWWKEVPCFQAWNRGTRGSARPGRDSTHVLAQGQSEAHGDSKLYLFLQGWTLSSWQTVLPCLNFRPQLVQRDGLKKPRGCKSMEIAAKQKVSKMKQSWRQTCKSRTQSRETTEEARTCEAWFQLTFPTPQIEPESAHEGPP